MPGGIQLCHWFSYDMLYLRNCALSIDWYEKAKYLLPLGL